MSETLVKLREIIEDRRNKNPSRSYVAKLFSKGPEHIAQKVGEEAVETIIAALKESKKSTVEESADLLFHLSMLWAYKGVKPQQVMKELQKRMGISGLDEKALRKAKRKGKA